MRFLSSLVMASFLIMAAPLAQASEADEIELTRQVIETERKAIVAENMGLTEEQATAFWPVYNDYQRDMRSVSDQYIALIQRYAEAYSDGVKDETAAEIMKDWLAMEADGTKVRKKYVKQFGKVLPTALVLRFFQIENKLTAVIRADVALQIPLD